MCGREPPAAPPGWRGCVGSRGTAQRHFPAQGRRESVSHTPRGAAGSWRGAAEQRHAAQPFSLARRLLHTPQTASAGECVHQKGRGLKRKKKGGGNPYKNRRRQRDALPAAAAAPGRGGCGEGTRHQDAILWRLPTRGSPPRQGRPPGPPPRAVAAPRAAGAAHRARPRALRDWVAGAGSWR